MKYITRTFTVLNVTTVDSVDNIELCDCYYTIVGDFNGDNDRILKEINKHYVKSNHKALFVKDVKVNRETYRMSSHDFIDNAECINNVVDAYDNDEE